MDNKKKVKSSQEKITEKPIVFLTGCIVLANLIFVYYNRQSNERVEKLFIGQNKPLIDVTPISISQVTETHSKTNFSVVNYSGFVAKNIAIDITYESNVWIGEWEKANRDNEQDEKGIVLKKCFFSAPNVMRKELQPGELFGTSHTGYFNLDKRVVKAGHVGYPILVRVKWENKRGHVFDEVHRYRLLCTEEKLGRAFAFIPEGIISYKNMR